MGQLFTVSRKTVSIFTSVGAKIKHSDTRNNEHDLCDNITIDTVILVPLLTLLIRQLHELRILDLSDEIRV